MDVKSIYMFIISRPLLVFVSGILHVDKIFSDLINVLLLLNSEFQDRASHGR